MRDLLPRLPWVVFSPEPDPDPYDDQPDGVYQAYLAATSSLAQAEADDPDRVYADELVMACEAAGLPERNALAA